MARKPKGSIIPPLPSWNIRNMYGTEFGIGPVALGDLVGSGVFNAQTDGSWLVIWDLQLFANGSPPAVGWVFDLNIIHGTQSFYHDYSFNTALPVCSQTKQIPSGGWGFMDSAANEASLPFLNYSLPVGGYQWVHDWPLCAIAPGDSIVAYSDANAYNTWGATWVFELVPGGI
jgi:hypothetical protein